MRSTCSVKLDLVSMPEIPIRLPSILFIHVFILLFARLAQKIIVLDLGRKVPRATNWTRTWVGRQDLPKRWFRMP